MSDFNYDGVHNLERDNPGQIEFNRRKNVEQDQRLSTLTSQVNELITQVPAGFLPRLYYALTRGEQKFRFIIYQEFGVENIPGNIGDAFELISQIETQNYIPAVATKINATTIKITIQGDYNLNVNDFKLINMATGDFLNVTLPNALSLQNASYLGDFDAQNSKGKQVTVLYDIETNEQNVIFASVDFSGDGIYNWIRIGGYVNGVSGKNIFGVTLANIEAVSHIAVVGDLLLAGTQFNYNNISFNIGDLAEVTGVNPLSIVYRGNIRGEQGAQGPAGATGTPGQNGLTPKIINGTWWLGDKDTGVKALGLDGTNGQNGQSFLIQSGLYSAPNNLNNPNNVGPNGETLQQLPTLPSSDISGKACVVFDPITTPLNPYYDLYFANNGDSNWTQIHPFTGLKGQDGRNGFTPYIQGNNWYINGQNTGVSATGPQGPQGDKGLKPMGNWVAENEYYVDDLVTYNGSSYLCINNHSGVTTPPNSDTINWLLFTAKGDTGPQGPVGATGATGPRGPAGATGAVATVVQTTGNATDSVMSQNAVTAELESRAKSDASNLSDEDVSSWANKFYPVGSIYLSVNDASPASFLGGTWEQIKDCFLWASGDTTSITYTENGVSVTKSLTAGSTGGETTHTLTVDEMPTHTHTTSEFTTPAGQMSASSGTVAWWTGGIGSGTGTTGGSQAHNNMPPYLAVYMWKRIA